MLRVTGNPGSGRRVGVSVALSRTIPGMYLMHSLGTQTGTGTESGKKNDTVHPKPRPKPQSILYTKTKTKPNWTRETATKPETNRN